MDVGSAEVKLEENKSLKNDLKKLKDELANTKKSEDCPPLISRGSTAYCCPLVSSINSTLCVQTQSWVETNIAFCTFIPNVTELVHC